MTIPISITQTHLVDRGGEAGAGVLLVVEYLTCFIIPPLVHRVIVPVYKKHVHLRLIGCAKSCSDRLACCGCCARCFSFLDAIDAEPDGRGAGKAATDASGVDISLAPASELEHKGGGAAEVSPGSL